VIYTGDGKAQKEEQPYQNACGHEEKKDLTNPLGREWRCRLRDEGRKTAAPDKRDNKIGTES